jgi:thiamine-phosphate pyrophosphorylase
LSPEIDSDMTQSRTEFLESASLYVLIDSADYLNDRQAPDLLNLVGKLISGGVQLIQLRDKRLNDRQLLDVAKRILELTRRSPTRFIMNDRVDLAVLSDSDGVHLGQDDLSVSEAKQIWGSERIIGVSTHSLEQARLAVQTGADYIGVGPVFPSSTKQFEQFVGLELLHSVAAEVVLPAFAIGGIDLSNVVEVVNAGVRRIAVSSVICRSADPKSAAEELLKKLRKG